MKTETMVYRHWDDVVFENRNKEYGAYSLRRSYSKSVIIGWGIAVAPFIIASFMADFLPPAVREVIPDATHCYISTIKLEPAPSFHQPKPKDQHQVKATKTNLPPLVVSEPVDNSNEPVQSSGTEINTVESGSVEGSSQGTGSAIVEQPVQVVTPEILNFAEVMPQYNGGAEAMMKYITRNTKYPASPRRMGIEGTVYVQFVIARDGTVTDVEIVRGIHPDCDKEAMRVISKMPTWSAGRQGDSPVSVRMVLPIKFALKN